jgi:enoyl-CoA hydratase
MAGHTAFDYSLLAEALGFFGPDVREGLEAVQDKRPPNYPSAQ